MSSVAKFTKSLDRLQETQFKDREQVEVPNAVRSRHSLPVPIADITVEGRLRSIDDDAVDRLAESMDRQGQLYPIDIRTLNEGGYQLVAGAHRMAAAEKLAWTDIEAFVLDELDDDTLSLHEIDENLCRAELNALDRGRFLARRKEIYERLHPETKHGANLVSPNWRHKEDGSERAPSFVENTAASTPWSERTIQRATRIGEQIDRALQDALSSTPIANRAQDLERISDMDADQQQQLLECLRTAEKTPATLSALQQRRNNSHPAPDYLKQLRTAWSKASNTERAEFREWLDQGGDE